MSLLDYETYSSFLDPNNSGTESQAGFLHLLSFLNTSRSGSAQSSAGISFRTFISSLMISVIFCVFQLCVFSLLRCKFKNIYQPNCYYAHPDKRLPPLKEGFFSWIPATIMHPMNGYLNFGLDAYFFLRYLCFLLVLFIILAAINIPVLIPVNFVSGYDNYKTDDLLKYTNGTLPNMAAGLDRISMSNIAPLFSKRLSIHLTMLVISILCFHGLLITELIKYVKIKNEHLGKQAKETPRIENGDRSFANTILIDNIPSNLLDRRQLVEVFSKIAGNRIKNIWFVYNYMDLKKYYEKNKKFVDKLEVIEVKIIGSKFYGVENHFITDTLKFKYNERMFKLWRLMDLRIRFDHYVVPKLYFQDMNFKLRKIMDIFVLNQQSLEERRNLLIARERSPLNDKKFNKVFIQFEDVFHPHLFNQIQISNKLNELDSTLIFINPKDLIWENLSVQSNALTFIRVLMGNTVSVLIILGWVIPVAFIGLISQLPYLTVLIPFLSWLNHLPDYITDVISNFLTVILLVCLSESVPYIFRWLSFIKCKKTGAQVELDVQNWMFIFLFIHIFMVVTISSGLTVIVESLLNNPVSIPNILARNLPKCSNFFFSYMIIRGLSYFGNNLLQNYQLLKNIIIYPFSNWTPRRKFERLTFIPSYKWGSIYPTFSVLGSIGLIYSILSPLILVFCCISFLMTFISFKYSLMYQFSSTNVSENYGQFYPKALFQLYSGIYFMEVCLIGLFVLSRDENGEANCLPHALFTFVLLILTAAGQIQIQKMFSKLLSKNLPLTLYEPGEDKNENDEEQVEPNGDLQNDTFHHPCFQDTHDIIWLPKDDFYISEDEIQKLEDAGIACSDEQCSMNCNGDINIHDCPPDYRI